MSCSSSNGMLVTAIVYPGIGPLLTELTDVWDSAPRLAVPPSGLVSCSTSAVSTTTSSIPTAAAPSEQFAVLESSAVLSEVLSSATSSLQVFNWGFDAIDSFQTILLLDLSSMATYWHINFLKYSRATSSAQPDYGTSHQLTHGYPQSNPNIQHFRCRRSSMSCSPDSLHSSYFPTVCIVNCQAQLFERPAAHLVNM